MSKKQTQVAETVRWMSLNEATMLQDDGPQLQMGKIK